MGHSYVIYLGHKAKQPLICSRSELSYGLEPHGLFDSRGQLCVVHVGAGQWGGCTRGGAGRVGTREGYTGYPAEGQIEAYLRNIRD